MTTKRSLAPQERVERNIMTLNNEPVKAHEPPTEPVHILDSECRYNGQRICPYCGGVVAVPDAALAASAHPHPCGTILLLDGQYMRVARTGWSADALQRAIMTKRKQWLDLYRRLEEATP